MIQRNLEIKSEEDNFLLLKEEIKFTTSLETYLEQCGLEKFFVKNSNSFDSIYFGKIPLIFQNNKCNIFMKLKKYSDYLELEVFSKKIEISEYDYFRKLMKDLFFSAEKNI